MLEESAEIENEFSKAIEQFNQTEFYACHDTLEAIGFRSVVQQEKLYKAQIQRRGSEPLAAKVSAPPGYSEHHTGYAVDLADGNYPKEDISFKFAETEAFRWLKLHAREFGFELSFPKNNSQGVSYEPWHWRFVGSPQAETVFQQARSHQPEKTESRFLLQFY